MQRGIFAACLTAAFVVGLSGAGGAVTIEYFASMGRTATADYSFLDATILQIILTETTPDADSALTGSEAILTSVGFLLPGDAVIVSGGSSALALPAVRTGAGSSSVGFDPNGAPPSADVGAGVDVSGEWGATFGGERCIGGTPCFGLFDFVSTNTAHVTQFPGANLDGPAGLNGPQGGLLADSAARGGLGVIDNSVIILLTLDANPIMPGNQGLNQTAFLNSLLYRDVGVPNRNSVVEYGSSSFGVVPEPGTLLLLGSGLTWLAWRRHRRR